MKLFNISEALTHSLKAAGVLSIISCFMFFPACWFDHVMFSFLSDRSFFIYIYITARLVVLLIIPE